MNIDKAVVEKLDTYLAKGLCEGIGSPDGQVCIEAAIALATGEPFSDEPSCVAYVVRSYSVSLNDSEFWASPSSRAAGMRELAIAQLGSAGVVEDVAFAKRLAELTIRELIPALFRGMPGATQDMLAAADRCEREGTKQSATAAYYTAADAADYAADAADAADYAADYAADDAAPAVYAASAANAAGAYGDHYLRQSAAIVVRVLRELGSPGCALLDGGKS